AARPRRRAPAFRPRHVRRDRRALNGGGSGIVDHRPAAAPPARPGPRPSSTMGLRRQELDMADDPRHPPRRIIVGIDGSEGARRALVWALAEARAHDAILEVVAAWALPADWAQGYNPERHVDLETKARLAAE